MLLEKTKIAVNDIISVKLINGEEIAGKLLAIDGKSYIIYRPVLLMLQDLGRGQGGVVFAPFMLGMDEHDKVVVQEDRMLVEPIKARADLAKQYTKATTGLEVPKNKLVV